MTTRPPSVRTRALWPSMPAVSASPETVTAGAPRRDSHRLPRCKPLPRFQVAPARALAGGERANERAAEQAVCSRVDLARLPGPIGFLDAQIGCVEHSPSGQRGRGDHCGAVDLHSDRKVHVPQRPSTRAAQADAGATPQPRVGWQVRLDLVARRKLETWVELPDSTRLAEGIARTPSAASLRTS